MKNRLSTIFSFCILCTSFLSAQTSVELIPSESIKVLGITNCESACVADHLFDNNVKTYFWPYQRSYAWAGLDLGEKHVITRVAYASADRPERLMLGVFEGANQADFSDAIPILVVKDKRFVSGNQNVTEVLIYEDVSCSKGFRYVRFVGPNDSRCKISELKFFGYKSEGDNSILYRPSNLPVVIIQTKDAAEIADRENYVDGVISIVSEEGFFSDNLQIRGRGNASWEFEKKPYRIKLESKAQLLGMPAKEKNWTLISNYGDKTLMRNLLAFDLSARFEMAYTPAGTPVDFILNGEYKGCYQLCDHVQIKPKRVNVDELELSDASDPYNIAGGYLIEVDAYAWNEREIDRFYSKSYNIPVTINKSLPDGTDAELQPFKNYIKNHFELFQTVLFGSNYKNLESGFRKYLDTRSFVRHFLIGEISGNTDTYWSTYMYKNRGDDKFYVGPIWDLDLAYENDIRTYPINNKSGWIYTSGSSANNMRTVVNRLLTDGDLFQEIRTTYSYYRDRNIISEEALVEVIDQYEDLLQESQDLNFTRWKIMNSGVHQNPIVWGSYSAEVESVRNYTKNRIKWMDNKLNYVPSSTLGMPDNSANTNLRIRTEYNALFINGIAGLSRISIYDVSGKLISQEETGSDYVKVLNKGAYIISVSDLESGIRQIYKCLITK